MALAPITPEYLAQQLEQPESEQLDFKQTLDLDSREGVVALAKDIAAMQLRGGVIVIGATDEGELIGELPERVGQLLDEAVLRSKLARYLPASINIASRVVELEGNQAGVIRVAPHPDGLVVMLADGAYERGGEPRTAFRRGDVLTRHGTASERIRQEDLDAALEARLARRKEEWRAELREELAHLGVAADAKQLVSGPADAFTWQLDAEAFEAGALELLRAGDRIPIQRLLMRLPRSASELLNVEQGDDFDTLLNRLSCLGALAITLADDDLLTEVLNTFVAIYNFGFDGSGHPVRRGPIHAPSLWLAILLRILALGALATRRRNWAAVAALASQRPASQEFSYYKSWMRHALTEAARAHLLDRTENGQRVNLSLIALSLDLVRDVSCLRPDHDRDDEALLDSLCEFDLLAALVGLAMPGDDGMAAFYPNFARYNWPRAEPALVAVIEDPEARAAIWPGTDASLAEAIREVSSVASSESWRYAAWSGWHTPTVAGFLDQHPAPDPPAA